MAQAIVAPGERMASDPQAATAVNTPKAMKFDLRAYTYNGSVQWVASYVFLLGDGGDVHAVPHALYVALARGEALSPTLAGQSLRLADWYVRLKDGALDSIANETYSLVHFDAQGRVDPIHSPVTATAHLHQPADTTAPESAGWPTVAERERMREMLFGENEAFDSSPAVPTA